MTPKEKAQDLYVKFSDYCSWNTFEEEQDYINNIKQCALIAVNEIIESSPLYPNETPEYLQPEDWFSEANIYAEKYWEEVKQEINNL